MEEIEIVKTEDIQNRIVTLRGMQVIIDEDLAKLYGVETYENLRSQFVTSSRGGRRYLPYAFTEQGVAMLSAQGIFNASYDRFFIIYEKDKFGMISKDRNMKAEGGSLTLAPAFSVAALPAVASATPSLGLRPRPRVCSLEVMV